MDFYRNIYMKIIVQRRVINIHFISRLILNYNSFMFRTDENTNGHDFFGLITENNVYIIYTTKSISHRSYTH